MPVRHLAGRRGRDSLVDAVRAVLGAMRRPVRWRRLPEYPLFTSRVILIWLLIGKQTNWRTWVADEPTFDAESVARLRRVIARLARVLNVSSSSEGLSPTQASVLAVVAYRGPLRPAELAEIEALNPTMLSRIVGKLVEGGLVRRLPDPADLRAAQVEVTDAGLEVDERIRAMRNETVAKILDGLPEETTSPLLAALPALEALANGLRDDIAP
ncbi:MAG: MarR family transcriptional regulator [Propionibacteriales bacterium]|nr:MarR family transcriptional regulator [Propionibacteriales bacterium]